MTLISEAPKPALDFSDLLSKEGAARRSSNIKGLLKYMSNPGMISLGGGECQWILINEIKQSPHYTFLMANISPSEISNLRITPSFTISFLHSQSCRSV